MRSFEESIRIPAEIEKMRDAVKFVNQMSRKAGMSKIAVHQCEVAVEEVVTNIIQHGYTDTSTAQHIDIKVEKSHEGLLITISDDARKYDPTQRPDPDPSASLEERKTGGWGVYFVKQYMDAVEYKWSDNRNHLILKKHISV